MSFFAELKRRNVFRVAVAYAVLSWLVLQIADVLIEALDLPGDYSKFILILLGLGLIPVLVFSWAYELTPEGIKRESEVSSENSQTVHTAKKLDIAVLVMLAAVLILFAVGKLGDPAPAAIEVAESEGLNSVTQIESVAVLAFEDFSEGGEQAHLAVGLADAVLHILAQIPDLRVSARTSSFSFRGTGTQVAVIGEELGVGAVLEGSVQRSGETLRIIAQLIRVSDQTHLWSQTFDRPTGDIFAIQDEIAQAVADALRPAAADEPAQLSSERTSLEAYEHFLRGNELWQQRSKESIEEAIEEFKAAIVADPNYAPAHAGLAMAYLFSASYGDRDIDEVRLLAEQGIELALAIDSDLSLAHAAQGILLGRLRRDDERAAALRRAIELNPSDATVYVWIAGDLERDPSRWKERTALLERAYALDPRNQYVLGIYAEDLARFGDFEGALAAYRRGISLNPDLAWPYNNLARLHERFGRLDDAIRARLAQIERAPDSWLPYREISDSFWLLGDRQASHEWFDRARALRPSLTFSSYWSLHELGLEQAISDSRARLKFKTENESIRYEQTFLCYAHVMALQYELALGICSEILAEVLDSEPSPLELDKIFAAQALAWAAREMGDTKTLDRLTNEMIRLGGIGKKLGVSEAGYQVYMAYLGALKGGDRGEVITRLQRAVELGFLNSGWLALQPWWGAYREDPEFQALLEDIHNRQTRQLNALRAEGL